MRATHTPVPSDHGHATNGDHHPDDFSVAFRRDLVLINKGDAPEEFTPPDGAEGELDAEELAAMLWDKGKDVAQQIGKTAEHLSRLLEREALAAYRVDRNRDPRELVREVNTRNDSSRASLVLVTTITGHWTYAPGTDATAPTGPKSSTAPITKAVEADKFVAVIDTGYSATKLPDWLNERAEALEPIDAEPNIPGRARGHGAFVASVIAQVAQDTNIRVARVRNLGPDDVGTDGHPADEKIRNGFGSDELQLYVAVERLLNATNPDTGQPYTWQALNLSLGSYTDDETAGLAIRAAMQLWNERTHGAPVFAAAGNHEIGEPPRRFIPAAYEDEDEFNICAIASCDDNGGLSDFSNHADTLALGRNLIGIRDDGECWEWSGSSFATAVATAQFLNTGPFPAGTTVPTPTSLPHNP